MGQENGQESTVYRARIVDFDFLKSQTFADEALECELLELFSTQSRRVLSTMSTLNFAQQADKAHLLKGSAQGIGAWAVAEAAGRFEAAETSGRSALLSALEGAVAAANRAIEARLADLRR